MCSRVRTEHYLIIRVGLIKFILLGRFGVCCLFSSSKSGDTIRENCSYVQNPNFPSVYTTSQAVTYTIEKCTKGVCFLRLDFEAFSILGPGSTEEVDGGICTDQLEVIVSKIKSTATGWPTKFETFC